MASRNRALRAIETLVQAKERAVIEAAVRFHEAPFTPGFGKPADMTEDLRVATGLYLDARALLAEATGTALSARPDPPTKLVRVEE